jgi:exopolysaccharide biosynthesis polyprenyl glycosylphosphotransferase
MFRGGVDAADRGITDPSGPSVSVLDPVADAGKAGRRLHRPRLGRPRSARAVGAPGNGALQRYRGISVGLAISDAVCLVVALIGSFYLRFPGAGPMPLRESLVVLLSPLLWVAVFHTFDLYAPLRLSAPEEFRRVIGASAVGIVLLAMVSFWSKSSFSRAWIGLTWALVLVLELLPRRWWRSYQWRLRMDGRLVLRTLIVGTSAEARRLAGILRAPASGFLPIGHVQTSEPAASASGLSVLGGIDELDRLIQEHHAECVFVASTGLPVDDVARVARAARPNGVEARVLANVPQMLTSRLALLKVGPAIAVALRPVRLSGPQAVLKRVLDLVVAVPVLVLSLPLCAVCAVAVRLDSRGPVFFNQERVTKGGRVFRMHKFRTMRTDLNVSLDTTTPFFKLQSDPRLTRVGAFLRRFSLDELPQLWNVITGEMSLVGPRPLPADQVAANLELLRPRHAVPAGVTGWWQINGRSMVTPDEALRLDLFYIENWSPTLDLYVLLKTFGAVVGRQGAC